MKRDMFYFKMSSYSQQSNVHSIINILVLSEILLKPFFLGVPERKEKEETGEDARTNRVQGEREKTVAKFL